MNDSLRERRGLTVVLSVRAQILVDMLPRQLFRLVRHDTTHELHENLQDIPFLIVATPQSSKRVTKCAFLARDRANSAPTSFKSLGDVNALVSKNPNPLFSAHFCPSSFATRRQSSKSVLLPTSVTSHALFAYCLKYSKCAMVFPALLT